MTYISDNVIPGDHGKIFSTDAKLNKDLKRIQSDILEIDGIKDVILNNEIYPVEFTVHTTKVVSVKDVQDVVLRLKFHTIPKGTFPLY